MESALRDKLLGGRFYGVTPAHSQRMVAIAGKGNKTTERRLRAGLSLAARQLWPHSPGLAIKTDSAEGRGRTEGYLRIRVAAESEEVEEHTAQLARVA